MISIISSFPRALTLFLLWIYDNALGDTEYEFDAT